jgi:hypothetical protein
LLNINEPKLRTMASRKKYKILSPDGFTIDSQVNFYPSMKKVKEAFESWKKRYEAQGYYSSASYGRIPLDVLEEYCTLIET